MTAPTDTGAPVIELRDLARRYVMGENVVHALDGVSLLLFPGEFLMVVGSSGSGKSTLMQILGCLDTPDSGEYFLRGQNITRLPDDQLSWIRNRRIGFVFQQYNLLENLTVIENIALPLAYRGLARGRRMALARQYAERLGLGDRLEHRPAQLSGGQAQRVAIARALVTEPDLVLADEPTGNLDSATSREILSILHDLNDRGYTIVMVTHDPKYADEGTRKITLSDGRIVGDAAGRKPARAAASAVAAPPTPDRPAGIGYPDLIRAGIREGLLSHLLRTGLTMLGIIIAVTGVIAMSSFSLGSKQKQAEQIRALGANLVCVQDRRLEGEKLVQARRGGSAGLTLADSDSLRRMIPSVRFAAASREIKVDVKSDDGAELSARVLGVTAGYLEVNNLRLARGRFFDETDRRQCARVAVIGHDVARSLAGDEPVGRVLHIGTNPHTIVGVLADRHVDLKELEASGISDPNNDLLIPLQTLLARTRYLDMRSEVDVIQLQLETEDDLEVAGTSIRRLLGVAHGGIEDFELIVPLDLLKQKQQAQRLLDVLTLLIASIALLVGGIGIMNIMLASVTERFREVGIRRAVGATRRDILHQFLSEAVVIAVTGGLTGVLLALAVVSVTCALFALPIVISPLMVTVAVAAATATGLVFGLYPAAQAAKKNPVEALRHE